MHAISSEINSMIESGKVYFNQVFTGIDLGMTDLTGVSFIQCEFDDVNFSDSELSELIFSRCEIKNCQFIGSKLLDVMFESSLVYDNCFALGEWEYVDFSETGFGRNGLLNLDWREISGINLSKREEYVIDHDNKIIYGERVAGTPIYIKEYLRNCPSYFEESERLRLEQVIQLV